MDDPVNSPHKNKTQHTVHDSNDRDKIQRVKALIVSWIKTLLGRSTKGDSTLKFGSVGFIRGFLLYFLPVLVLRRRLEIPLVRRSLAIALWVTAFRMMRKIYKENKQNLQASMLGRFFSNYNKSILAIICTNIALVIDGNMHKSQLVMFWFLVRCLKVLSPAIPHGPTIVMCLSCSQILSTWLFAPKQLEGNYRRFLDWHGGQRIEDVKWALQQGDHKVFRPCFLIHPHLSCESHIPIFWLDCAWRSLYIYLPLHFLLYLLSASMSAEILLVNVIRSCAFLATYVTLAWSSGCFVSKIFPKIPFSRFSTFLHLWVGGLATELERPKRQAELAAYCLTYAIDSVWNYVKTTERGKHVHLPVGFLLVGSMAVLSHQHREQPSFITDWLLELYPQKNKNNSQEELTKTPQT